MAQIKKDDVRANILLSAREEFGERGYAATTMRGIAARAGMSPSNVYVYFSSKFDLLFAIYDPWWREQIIALETSAAAIEAPRQRLRMILSTLWKTLPSADRAFGSIFIEGLAVSGREGTYSRDLLHWTEQRIAELIKGCLPPERRDHLSDTALAHVLFMAFDGFAVNTMLVGSSRRMERCIDVMTDLIWGEMAAAGDRAADQSSEKDRARLRVVRGNQPEKKRFDP